MLETRVPVSHTVCKQQVGWNLNPLRTEPPYMRSEDYERLDGTHPVSGTLFAEHCPTCDAKINGFRELEWADG